MKHNKTVFLLTTFTVLLGGCVASNDAVEDVYRRQSRLEAKTEVLSRNLETIEERMQTVSTTGIEAERVTQLEERIKQMEQAFADLNERLSQLEIRELGSALPSTSRPEAPTVGEETLASPSLYTQGYTNLSQGNYRQAREQFKSFISENPNSPEAVDALYWVAESYYREGKFEEAILEFQRFIDTYPQDAKVPLAFLKQGLSLINIGREEEAKLFLQTLIDKFPESEEARIAREKLKELESKG